MGIIVESLKTLSEAIDVLKNNKFKIIFTSGCFDLYHIGHARMLKEAKYHGDILVVGLNSDKSIKKIKGEDRPIISEQFRAEVLCYHPYVNYIILFDEPTPIKIIEEIKPDVLINSDDLKNEEIIGYDTVISSGGKSIKLLRFPYLSTSGIIDKIISSKT